jgi:hypothetical protein
MISDGGRPLRSRISSAAPSGNRTEKGLPRLDIWFVLLINLLEVDTFWHQQESVCTTRALKHLAAKRGLAARHLIDEAAETSGVVRRYSEADWLLEHGSKQSFCVKVCSFRQPTAPIKTG